MNKVSGKIKIWYLLVEKFEGPLDIPERPSIENIGIFYNYGPGVRGTNAQRLPSPMWEHSHQDFKNNQNNLDLIEKQLELLNFSRSLLHSQFTDF